MTVVTDQRSVSDTQSFTVTVDDVNEAPSASSTRCWSNPGSAYSYDVSDRRMQAIR